MSSKEKYESELSRKLETLASRIESISKEDRIENEAKRDQCQKKIREAFGKLGKVFIEESRDAAIMTHAKEDTVKLGLITVLELFIYKEILGMQMGDRLESVFNGEGNREEDNKLPEG